MTRTTLIAVSGAAALTLGIGGWAAADALWPTPAAVPASAGRLLTVVYEVRRAPGYVPPAITEATRLEVLTSAPSTIVDEGVLSAGAGEALRTLQAQDLAATTEALAAIRAQDARIDRETASMLAAEQSAGSTPPA